MEGRLSYREKGHNGKRRCRKRCERERRKTRERNQRRRKGREGEEIKIVVGNEAR